MQAIHPYLTFDGNAEEAFLFYRSVFGGDFPVKVRFSDMGGGPPGASPEERKRIAHVSLPLGGSMLMASDTVPSQGREHRPGNNFSISLAPDSAEEAERIFRALSAGGRVEMELQPTAWAEKFGTCSDRFGIQWMVSYAGKVQFSPPAGNAA
jgi:PhnB protein